MSDKQIAKKQDTSITPASNFDWNEAPALTSQDYVISKILPMQGLSDKVMDQKAAFGELRDSVTNECYGGIGKPMEFIPFHMSKVWVEEDYDQGTKKYKYARMVPITALNDNLPYEESGVVKRTRQYNFFVLLPVELKEGSALPKLLSFKSTSLQAGKILNTQMYQMNKAAKLAPYSFVMKLSVKSEKNDKGTYAVLSVEKVRRATGDEEAISANWYATLKAGTVKVDERETPPAHAEDDIPFDNRPEAERLASPGKF